MATAADWILRYRLAARAGQAIIQHRCDVM